MNTGFAYWAIAGMMVVGSAAASPLGVQPQDSGKPVSIIFDTDIGTDVDDAGALAILHVLADRGEAKVLATISANRNRWCGPALDAINTYYGRGDMPIGCSRTGPDPELWYREHVGEFEYDLADSHESPPAVDLYRKILAGQPDDSVTIVVVGWLTNMAELLDSRPDRYSALGGRDLVRAKVRELVAMGGTWPNSPKDEGEYNFSMDRSAAHKVIRDWPGPILFTGLGNGVMTAKRLVCEGARENPVPAFYRSFFEANKVSERPSWDLIAVLYAVRGVSDYFTVVSGGKCVSLEDGGNQWIEGAPSNHAYLDYKMPPQDLAAVLEDLLLTPRARLAERIDPQRGTVDPCDGTVWYDGRLVLLEGRGWEETESHYDRLPAKAKLVVRAPVWDLSRDSAGLCLRFATDAAAIRVRWTLRNGSLAMPHMPATGVSGIDLYCRTDRGRWTFVQNGRPAAISNEASFRVPPGAECMLYLPLYNGLESIAIGVPKGKTLSRPAETSSRPIVFYGTSITQGGCASRPGMACTAIVGRMLDVPVINLGFSGNGKMEPEMADLLAELDPAVYVIDCLWNMRPEEVSERLAPFVKKLRAARSDTPILLAEDSSVSNTTPTQKGAILRRIYEDLKAEGILNLHFLSNRDMLGADGDGAVDGCHPNDVGMLRQATVFSKALSGILGKAK
ncbi:MAG TPA: SGNH/GDSL hydrolase family protein [Sedimentisphaerales bacterium]|nr:SGNH/GDSL hydrolase family protein [Sedimentisphaerales bacterium]